MPAQNASYTLPELLFKQFKTTYDEIEWFVAFQKAVHGLSHGQATQKLTPQGDTIFGVVAHLTYWNERYLRKMKGEQQQSPMLTDNALTFKQNSYKDWNDLITKAESVFEKWTKHLSGLTEKDEEHFNAIANTSMHNAYHIGQIVMLRKLQGSWDKEQGVK